MLARIPALDRARAIAARRHERLDGSGYPRGLTAAALAPPDHLLAAAGEPRLARGHPDKQIARRLAVSPKTVSSHVEHIYAKLDVSSRAAATLFATQHGLTGTYESVG